MAETRLLRSAEPAHELGIPLGVIVAMYVDHNRLHSLLPMIVLCAFSFARSRVRAFPRSRVQWLDVLARSARSASAPRRGRKTGPHAAKHTAAKERANARTRERANAEAAG